MSTVAKPSTKTAKRVGGICAVAALMGGTFAALPSPASASEVGATAQPTYEVDVVNHSGTDVKVRFFYGPGEHQGDVNTDGLPDAQKLPTSAGVPLDSGAKSANYAYKVGSGTYDNGYWVEVTRGDDPNDRTVAKMYRWNPGEQPASVKEQAGTGFKIESHYEQKQSGYSDKKTRIVISEARANTETAFGGADFPYPLRWELDTRVGTTGSPWKDLGDGSQQWKLENLQANADYWFRCYDTTSTSLAFNGYFPKAEELGGGLASDGRGKGFWATSDKTGAISVLRPSGAASQGGVCDVHSAPNKVTAKRITGTSTDRAVNERPIYKVDIEAKTRAFAEDHPSQLRVPPYVVEGKDSSGQWRKVGTVLPSSTTSASGKRVSHGGSDFLFQNKAGESITQLRVTGGYGTSSNEIPLSSLPAPTVTMNDISAMEVKAQSAAGRITLEANGAVQEELSMKLFDQNGTLIPQSGGLSDAYDSIYFRDENGKLITGMHGRDGASAVSRHRGATINTGAGTGAMGAQSVEKNRAYLSTTDSAAGLTWLTPTLDLDDHMDTVNVDTRYTAPTHRLTGTISSGVPIAQNTSQITAATASTSAAPTYRVKAAGTGAVDNPASVAVFRYNALVPADELPRENIQKDKVASLPMAVQAGTLKLATASDLTSIENLKGMTVHAVTKHGTAVGPYQAPK
ncbi:hypothetical protein [Streptomyces sp. ADI96-02]|uniref:hypothetical protein n=1 Tax=Streptomyces sp. ADI96-02 TaxID=1522760 RepID=UPI0019D02032|nr:hypothetical protein [Streptomyces sp. ADI96-02]